VDDGSTDRTPEIIRELAEDHPEISYRRIEVPRYFKGWNIAYAINETLKDLLSYPEIELLIRMDSDAILRDPKSFEKLVSFMERNPTVGISGAYFRKPMIRHVTDAVRVYRRDCLEKVMETNPLKPGSFVIFRARFLGWWCRPADVQYLDLRPYSRTLIQWSKTGRFRYENGFGLLHEIGSTVRYLRAKPYVLGSVVSLLSWIIFRFFGHRRLILPDYQDYTRRDLDYITLMGIRKMLKRSFREVIY
jgi:glycosyltransferase involved in cell wall biosynthesis